MEYESQRTRMCVYVRVCVCEGKFVEDFDVFDREGNVSRKRE